MTGLHGRPEIIIEGSYELNGSWTMFEFHSKPGKLNERPRFVCERLYIMIRTSLVMHFFALEINYCFLFEKKVKYFWNTFLKVRYWASILVWKISDVILIMNYNLQYAVYGRRVMTISFFSTASAAFRLANVVCRFRNVS